MPPLFSKGQLYHYAPENRENYPCYAVLLCAVTPMLPSGDIDWVSLAALVEYHVDAGTSAIVAVGTTGESVTLSEQEHIAVVEKTVEYAAGRIPVIAGCGSNNTAHAIALSRRFATMGVVAGLSVTLLQQTHLGRPLSSLLLRSPRLVVCLKFSICARSPAVTSNPRRWPVWPKVPGIIGLKEGLAILAAPAAAQTVRAGFCAL